MELDFNLSVTEKVLLLTLNIIGAAWNILSFLPWYVGTQAWRQPRVGTIQGEKCGTDPKSPWRNIKYMPNWDNSQVPRTLSEMFRCSAEKHGSRPCFGTRELIKEEDEIQPDGKVFKKVILGDYKWITYSEAYERAMNFGRGLASMGLTKGNLVTIFADTCMEWMLCAQGCFAYGYHVCTLFTSLAEEAVVQGINESEASVLVVDKGTLLKYRCISSQLPYIKMVVVLGSRYLEQGDSVKMYSSSDVELLGSKPEHRDKQMPTIVPSDVAVIMYTSGSTGKPKGVVMSHQNVLSILACCKAIIKDIGPDDRTICYLPLAHVIELMIELISILLGASMGYSSPWTLTDQSTKIKKGSKGDISVLKPTVLAAVPLIFDRIRSSVFQKVKQMNRASQLLFSFAYNYKLRQIARGYDTPILNRTIFKKICNQLGGRIRFLITGGAPLSDDTKMFLNTCFCCPLLQVYGLTETCGGGAFTNKWDNSCGRIGPPPPYCSVRLADWVEGGYLTTDKPHPRGEIIIGGPTVTLGYFKNKQLTDEVYFVEDGIRWFRSGDIGCMHADGCLQIVDRKKDLVKLSHGEYISLGRIESVLRQCQYVENCLVVARSLYSFVLLLVLPNQLQIKQLAEKLGIVRGGDSRILVEELYDVPEIQTEVVKAIKEEGVRAKLSKVEMPLSILLVKEIWTSENGLLTASLKIRRKPIEDMYADVIDQLYQHVSAKSVTS